ncbi:TIGR00341 family protein [soil metagenome]
MSESNGVAEAVEEAASEKLGVEQWDRPAILRDALKAATENGLPYWAVLSLSGAIATLGLAINSSAVVIGAMLVAPLLAPVIGLALSFAVGDGRLAVQTSVIVLASTLAVVAVGALLTVLLPFHTITLEISARVRPTTLDLAIAVFSGLVGAVVTVGRRSRLSAAIPGVAIAVALIPPLGVAGFGIGVGDAELIRGSLLLYGANLAGIVLSGMGVFMLVGMHRSEVVRAAREWHEEAAPHGLAAYADRIRWVRTMGVFRSPIARIALVLSFVVALGWPLSATLAEVTRETRIERAVGSVEREIFHAPGRASVLSKQVVIGANSTQVFLRVATNEWFEEDERMEFERQASTRAGESVHLTLEQLPARGSDVEVLADLLSNRAPRSREPASAEPARLAELLRAARLRIDWAVESLALPAAVEIVSADLTLSGMDRATLLVSYAAPMELQPQAEEMLRVQLLRALEISGMELSLRYAGASSATRSTPSDTLPAL